MRINFTKAAFFFLVLVSGWFQSSGQLCTGSLGDPIVKFTFGYDTLGFGLPPSPLAPGITNYPFVANSCPDDGFYSIADIVPGCHGNTWHPIPEDHTAGDLY